MSRRNDFRLDVHSKREPEDDPAASPSSTSTAIIVHPMSLFSSPAVTSPLYGCGSPEWLRQAIEFQRQEVQQQWEEQQQQQQQQKLNQEPSQASPTRQALSLLDYTCEENVRTILSFLDGVSLCAASRVCRYFHAVSDDDSYWLHLCQAEWAISPEQLRERPASYQALYKFACQSLKRLIRDFFEEQCLVSMQTSFRIPRDAALSIARRTFVAP
ncbi:hypothetical protein PINS_up002321 [Pythium insidiosum]|nr:hypothetical protein PINS_up002321 [Pythium insidiosum]